MDEPTDTQQDSAGDPAVTLATAESAQVQLHPVARHYTHSALLSALLDALSAAGRSVSPIDSDELSSMDEMHTGGHAATIRVAEALAPEPGTAVLDLGCGLGGVTRYLARHHGVRATGIDLTREHVEVAQELTERCGLTGQVDFHRGDVTALPFEPGSFAASVLMHVGMNVTDKAALCTEAYRVLRPGGRFVIYDLMLRSSVDELGYPVPWASSPEISFLEPSHEYHRLVTNAGFTVKQETDLTELVRAQLHRLLEVPDDQLPPVGRHVVMGESFRVKLGNLAEGLARGVVAPVMLVAVR